MSINTNLWNRIRYSCWAPIYDLIAVPTRPMRRRSLALANLQPGERVLFVGAGTGLDLDFITAGPIVTATDLTPAMLEKLRRRAEQLNLAVGARVMDGHALEFADGSFDVVVLHFIVAVIPDPVRCIREAARVLRPGGRAVILDKFAPDDGPMPLWLRLLNPLAIVLATNVNRRLGSILAGSGLRVVHREAAALRGFFQIALAVKD
ncbi:MAG: methyltransferase domain-containing protein [Verrucomicrobia bacterium]|nr:methyltransferase domain-containing protein [Verrucomicrobiota bacterium]